MTRRMLVMERLSGFNFSDVEGMRAAGIDTDAVVRSGMIGFLEGAMMHGIFHGDLHGGNLFILPSGKIALLDFGITARLSESKRVALLSLIVAATERRRRDTGNGDARPRRVPGEHRHRRGDRPTRAGPTPGRPHDAHTRRAGRRAAAVDEDAARPGARMPKELMLFVKNLVFLDGAIATLAPDLDLFGEIEAISLLFAQKHGERIMQQLGLNLRRTGSPTSPA